MRVPKDFLIEVYKDKPKTMIETYQDLIIKAINDFDLWNVYNALTKDTLLQEHNKELLFMLIGEKRFKLKGGHVPKKLGFTK